MITAESESDAGSVGCVHACEREVMPPFLGFARKVSLLFPVFLY